MPYHGITCPKPVLGSELPKALQEEVKRMYVHRYTADHRPEWVEGTPYDGHPHFGSDEEWLASTEFKVTSTGALDKRCKWCYTTGHSWPNGMPNLNQRGSSQ